MQLTHHTSNFTKQSFPITLICDGITNAPNIGSLFRIADAFGIDQLIFCGENTTFGKRMMKTSRSTEKYVNYKIESDIETVLKRLKLNNHYFIALEITENSEPLSTFHLNTNQPIVLIIGNENFGISDVILKHIDTTLHITMYGHNSSMNVTQAASIALYEITKQLNKN